MCVDVDERVRTLRSADNVLASMLRSEGNSLEEGS